MILSKDLIDEIGEVTLSLRILRNDIEDGEDINIDYITNASLLMGKLISKLQGTIE